MGHWGPCKPGAQAQRCTGPDARGPRHTPRRHGMRPPGRPSRPAGGQGTCAAQHVARAAARLRAALPTRWHSRAEHQLQRTTTRRRMGKAAAQAGGAPTLSVTSRSALVAGSLKCLDSVSCSLVRYFVSCAPAQMEESSTGTGNGGREGFQRPAQGSASSGGCGAARPAAAARPPAGPPPHPPPPPTPLPPRRTCRGVGEDIPLHVQVLPHNQGLHRAHLQARQRVLHPKHKLARVLADLVEEAAGRGRGRRRARVEPPRGPRVQAPPAE